MDKHVFLDPFWTSPLRQTSLKLPRTNRVFEGVCENNLFALPHPHAKEISDLKEITNRYSEKEFFYLFLSQINGGGPK